MNDKLDVTYSTPVGYTHKAPLVEKPVFATYTGDATATMSPLKIMLDAPSTYIKPRPEIVQGDANIDYSIKPGEQERNENVNGNLIRAASRAVSPGLIITDALDIDENSPAGIATSFASPLDVLMAAGFLNKGRGALNAASKLDRPSLAGLSKTSEPLLTTKINPETGLPFSLDDVRPMLSESEKRALLLQKKAELDRRITSSPIPKNVHIRTLEEGRAQEKARKELELMRANQLRAKMITQAEKDIDANKKFVQTHKHKADSAAADAERLYEILHNLRRN